MLFLGPQTQVYMELRHQNEEKSGQTHKTSLIAFALIKQNVSRFLNYILFFIKLPRIINMLPDNTHEMSRQSAFKKLTVQQPNVPMIDDTMEVTNQMLQVINAQNNLIMKLLQRQNQLCLKLSQRQTSQESGSGESLSGQPHKKQLNQDKKHEQPYRYHFNSSEQLSNNKVQNRQQVKAEIKIIQSLGVQGDKAKYNNSTQPYVNNFNHDDENNQDEDFVFLEDQNESHKDDKKQTETKNMIKNFAKGIFNFIKKNRDKRTAVLDELGIKQEEFMKMFYELKGKIHSLSELRSLWMTNGNIYNKAFRILSSLYLRKHCLQKTFNSRIENYTIHMKYRNRLREGLANPIEFTVLKTN